ncbi:MAG TPA: 50S ribosomal protein L11 methyltransferase [Gemmatimonadaceae bacterium]
MSGRWLAIKVEPSLGPQAVVDALFSAGAQGVQEQGSAIITHFPPGTRTADIEAAILAADAGASIVFGPAPEVNWSEWRASVVEHRLGRITISPPWIIPDDESIVVTIDPAMAFGTGEHATTRGVVRLMQRIEQMPARVADLGAGSAVLAICAAKLGAERVAAIELDPDAIGNAEENVAVNGVADRVTVVEGDAAVLLPLVAPVGLVLANIISSVLLQLLPVIAASLTPDGRAILSGILEEERGMMTDAIGEAGFVVDREDLEDNWWSVLIARPR